jgi:hypothetical protein
VINQEKDSEDDKSVPSLIDSVTSSQEQDPKKHFIVVHHPPPSKNNYNSAGPETPKSKMARIFYEKYHINPLDTVQSMKALKKINMKQAIQRQVHLEMKEFNRFFNQQDFKQQINEVMQNNKPEKVRVKKKKKDSQVLLELDEEDE